MNSKPLSSVIKRVALGYVLIYFNINIGTLNLLPNWAGYLLIVSALPFLSQKEGSAILLKPLGVTLALWSGFEWVFALFGGKADAYLIGVTVGILNIYFHFQLITNISEFASEPNRKKRLLILRSATVIFCTATVILLSIPDIRYAAIITGIAQCVMCVWVCVELCLLSSALKREEAITKVQSDISVDSGNENPC